MTVANVEFKSEHSLWTKAVRPYVIAVLVIAAIMRVGFLCSGEVLPVMWDARRYVAAAIGIISYFDDSGPEPATNNEADREVFLYYYDKYVQGEKIDWMYYPPHRLRAARAEIFFAGPVYPAVVAAIIAVAPAHDFTVVRIFGLILDLLSNMLLMIVVVRLCNHRAALIAGLAYAIYFPFVLMSSMLLLETSTSFLLLLTMALMLRALRSETLLGPIVLAGISAGLLALNKPTAQLLFVPLYAGLYLIAPGRHGGPRLKWMIPAVVPVLLIIGGWVTATSIKYGQLAVRDPAYAATNLRQSSSIDFEGYDLDNVEPGFSQREVYPDILERFPNYLGLFAKKFERLYSRPYNDFEISYLLSARAWVHVHELFLFLGLVGLVLVVRERGRFAAWPIMIVLYYTGLHIVFHSINRYSFNAIPMLFVGTGFLVDHLIRSVSLSLQMRRLVAIAIGMGLLGWLMDHSWWLQLGMSLSLSVVIGVLIVKLCLLSGSAWAMLSAGAARPTGWRHFTCLAPIAVTLILMIFMPVLSRDGWTEFRTPLQQSGDRAGIRLHISNLAKIGDEDLLAVLVDIDATAGADIPFSVSVNNRTQKYWLGEQPLARYFYPKKVYAEYARLKEISTDAIRRYAIIPVKRDSIQLVLDSIGFIEIEISPNYRTDDREDQLSIYGNYPTGLQSQFIPSPRHISVERYVDRQDPRLRQTVNFLSDSTDSYYIASGDSETTSDLSPLPGFQEGRYNIFLVGFKRSGQLLVY